MPGAVWCTVTDYHNNDGVRWMATRRKACFIIGMKPPACTRSLQKRRRAFMLDLAKLQTQHDQQCQHIYAVTPILKSKSEHLRALFFCAQTYVRQTASELQRNSVSSQRTNSFTLELFILHQQPWMYWPPDVKNSQNTKKNNTWISWQQIIFTNMWWDTLRCDVIGWLASCTLRATRDAVNNKILPRLKVETKTRIILNRDHNHPKQVFELTGKLHFHTWNKSFKLGHVEEESQLMDRTDINLIRPVAKLRATQQFTSLSYLLDSVAQTLNSETSSVS